ncbi:MAG: hypothetical protein OXJ52_05785 [Oligoflexia bacterium]|nr:hypothetical protein [Oligoflexia bacterium]
MKVLFLFILSQGLWANTLLETETAVGIANTLQGTAQGNPQKVLNQVKDTVNNYEQVQKRQIGSIQAPPNFPPAPNVAGLPPSPNNNQEIQQQAPQSQSNPESNNILDQATLSDQERNQIQELSHPPAQATDNPPAIEHRQNREEMTESNDRDEVTEDYFKTERIVEMEDKPIDYKTATQIFYKKDCQPSQSNCKRSGAVLTNIKSVIFNYAHSRGSFSENK